MNVIINGEDYALVQDTVHWCQCGQKADMVRDDGPWCLTCLAIGKRRDPPADFVTPKEISVAEFFEYLSNTWDYSIDDVESKGRYLIETYSHPTGGTYRVYLHVDRIEEV